MNTIAGIIANAYERKFFQEELRDSELNFRSFFETMNDMLIISDLNGKIIHCNKSLIDKLRYSLLELQGMSIIELHPLDQRRDATIIVEKMLTGETDYCPLQVQSKTGEIYSVETRVWLGKWNKQDCIFSISKDLTEENENAQLFSKIFENNPLPMIISSIDGGAITNVNSAFSKATGYYNEDLVGKTLDEISIFVDAERLEEIENRTIKDEKVRDEDLIVKCKDGSLLNVMLSVETIINQGRKSFLTVLVDITFRKKAEEILRESERRFLLALDETKAGLWDYDLKNKKLYISPMFKENLGYEEDEIGNSVETWKQIWQGDDQNNRKTIDDFLSGKIKKYEVANRIKHKDGSWRWILSRGGVLKDDRGIPYRWIGTSIDMTKEYEQSEELERFFSINLDLLCIADTSGNFIKTNKAWEDILGYSKSELNGKKFLDFIHIDDIPRTLEAMKKLDKGEKVIQFTNRFLSADGTYHYIEWRSNAYEGIIYAAARDITGRIKYEKKILELSNRDVLTSAYNRRYVYDRAVEIIEEYKRLEKVFSICIIDIDRFKGINDNYGHQAGDYILKEFTKIIDENLRPYDILGRFGGEEFIVVLKNANEQESYFVIQRILNIIRKKVFKFDGKDIRFTFSAGVASCKEILKDEMIIDDLVEIADKRMYEAKNSGRNKIIY